MQREFKGELIRITVQDRHLDSTDTHQCFSITDEYGAPIPSGPHEARGISSYWLDEMIFLLMQARVELDKTCKRTEWGWERE